ncbi:DnaJ domain-containing protein [Methylocystis bryophila]|uniref:Molecular chaperone DnaJ n=1 Tax=Methylocystis bryophila TaxID=655015 RepID=A0A1W6MZD7_9HYPH|nr:DnaJ domain-containing protein [Methylocystis bryophila]ARN82954.1 molecular chaperone DnaJ [Methylocystis bryophila]BDV39242.1 molecular chaperone DnaJ [Methylocystis bryophila]
MSIILGVLVATLAYLLLRAYAQASPRALAKTIRFGGGTLCALVGGLLVLRGVIAPGLAILGLGLWLIDFSALTAKGFRSARRGGGVSRVRTAIVEMELDRTNGAIRGTVLAGPQEGMPFDQLTRSQLLSLYHFCLSNDPQGARLLEAYFDRRFAGWRQAEERGGDSRSAGARRRQSISEEEAYQILGLKKGAPASEIARAHRDLMKKLHPDHGGATDLAARVNEAKDVLMRGRQV